MTINMTRMREEHENQQRGGEFLQFELGETLLYMHPQCRPDDKWKPTQGCPHVPVAIHYGVGKRPGNKGAMVVSLDKESNPIIAHPFVTAFLDARLGVLTRMKVGEPKKKFVLPAACPMATYLASGEPTEDALDDMRAQTRTLWGATKIGWRKDSSQAWVMEKNPKPAVVFIGKQLFDGFMAVFFDNGDITDPDSAVLVRVVKTKTGKRDQDVKYEVKAEPSTIKKPYVISKALRLKLADAIKPGGDCDLFRIASSFVKSPKEIEALISGVPVTGDAGEFDEEPASPPPRRGKPAAVVEEPAEDDEAEVEEAAPAEDDEALVDAATEEVDPSTIEHSDECIAAGGSDCVEDCPVYIWYAEQAANAEGEPEAATEEAEAEPEATEEVEAEEVESTEEEAVEPEVEVEPEAEPEPEPEPEAPPPKPVKPVVKPAAKPAAAPAKPAPSTKAAVPAKPAAATKPAAKPAADDVDLGLKELEAEISGMVKPPAKPAAKPAVAAKPTAAPAKPAVAAKPAAPAAKPVTAAAKPAAPAARPAVKK